MEMDPTKPAPRTPLKLEVAYKKNYAREEAVGVLKNISLTGAFLEAPSTAVRPEDKIQLFFLVSGRMRKVSARIIWKNQFGFGVQFLPMNKRDVQIVDDLIYFVESQRDGHRGVLDQIFYKVS